MEHEVLCFIPCNKTGKALFGLTGILGLFYEATASRELKEMILFPGKVWIHYIVSYLHCFQLHRLEPGTRKLPSGQNCHLLDESPLLTSVPKVSRIPRHHYAGIWICWRWGTREVGGLLHTETPSYQAPGETSQQLLRQDREMFKWTKTAFSPGRLLPTGLLHITLGTHGWPKSLESAFISGVWALGYLSIYSLKFGLWGYFKKWILNSYR